MAQMQDAQYTTAPDRANVLVKLTNLTGAALSLVLIVGVGVWGYKLLVRDVSGVPVVRAAEGPMRVQPADPGGSAAEHQGLAVNSVAAEGSAAAPADRLVLAPPPLELTLEDVPTEAPEIVQQAEATPTAEAGASDPLAARETLQNASLDTLVEQLSAGVPAISGLEAAPAATPAPEVIATPAPVKGGIGTSLRPRVRPAKLTSIPEAVALAVAAAQSAPSAEVNPETIAVGTRLAQLGAFDSPEVARGEWDRLSAKFGDFLEGKQRVIQRAESGGRTFYRLRAMGFADLGDARRFCSALVAERAECIPVVTR
ncbi:MAG: SPOR domain-containing protein [Roseovarius sp.]|nr:SPOR domain-containing protein [Roseovarius sp.]